MASKCVICGKYCKKGQAAHVKCLNSGDVTLEKIFRKGAWASKGRYAEGNPSRLWLDVKDAHRHYMYNGGKIAKERYDKAYGNYKKAGGTRPRPKWYYGC